MTRRLGSVSIRRVARLFALAAPFALAALLPLPAARAAGQAADQAVDPERFYQLASQLRCLVCQNESLADSDASLAQDLKGEIRARMAAGQSDEQIKQFLVDRYGNFVIYRPPFDATTLLLWIGPLLLLTGGFFAVWRGMRIGRGGGGDSGNGDGGGDGSGDNGGAENAAQDTAREAS